MNLLRRLPSAPILALALAPHLPAQETAPAAPVAAVHEAAPILEASKLIKPEFLTGPHHRILETVHTQGFANQYTVETDWGTYPVWGNDLLLKRIKEFEAIARLEKASKSDEFKQSLRKAAASPLIALGGAIQDPKGAIKGLGQGAARFINRAGEAIERGGAKSANTDSGLAGIVGLSRSKREIAGHLDVDPYTDNQILQQRLDEMARANFAGGFVVRASTFALSAGADMKIATWSGRMAMASTVAKMVHENNPLDLSNMNRETLKSLGVSEPVTETFLEHPHISPTQQTSITVSLKQLGPIGGMENFLSMTTPCRSSADAQFFVLCAELMAQYHATVSPAQQVLNLNGLPAIHTISNALVIPLAVDYVSWTPEADRLTASVASYNPQVEISQRVLFLSGRVSPLARQQLELRGFALVTDLDKRLYLEQAP